MGESADVVVVGAGVVGAAAAWALAEEGLDVQVLERAAVNRQGSGTTAGNLHIQAIHAERPGQAVPVDIVRFLPLQRAASDLWDILEDRLERDIGLRRTGGLTVAETQAEVETLRAKQRLEAAHGIPTEVLTGAELHAFAPEIHRAIPAATWCPWDGYANPLQVTTALLEAAVRRGARIDAFRAVRSLHNEPGGWSVGTDSGSISTANVIDAAGPALPVITAMTGVHLTAEPAQLQMHITTRVPPLLPRLVQHVRQGLSAKQVAAGHVLIGGGWPACPPTSEHAHSAADVHSIARNLALACRVLPALGNLELLRVWAGPVLATADEMPVIGELGESTGLFVCGGTYAFTLAPLWAEVLRCLVLGKVPPVGVADLTPNRLVQQDHPSSNGHSTQEGNSWTR